MKVKELKKLLEGVDENANVLISDVEGACLQLVGGGEMTYGGIVLDVRQEFPDAWFRGGEEVRWMADGTGVIPKVANFCYDEIIIVNKDAFGDDNEHHFNLTFHDGYAEGEGLRLEYPKLDEITDVMLEEINKHVGGAITDSGVFNQHDVALKFGKVAKYERPVKRLDYDSSLICESVQNITLVAWPMIYGKDNPHDLNSAEVLDFFRKWGEEFESWWINHTEEWISEHDYVVEVENFAEKRATEWLRKLTEC